MGLLYGAGVSLQQLLLISREAAGNVYLAERFALIEQEVMAGKSLARAFETTKAFPSMMIHLLRIGEQSGQLEQRLQDISLHYQREVERLLAQIEPWLEPMITLMLALLLGWIVMAVIMPVYDVIG
jgi:type IV pilus assembly protein PilC